ncbi:hypothetical protein B0H14DRAFT_2621803 [Mycena olivaceomarginata]|nr:hypothetical protein B0H14DRAFT_2621803 [Mycena olivaceomarginata]
MSVVPAPGAPLTVAPAPGVPLTIAPAPAAPLTVMAASAVLLTGVPLTATPSTIPALCLPSTTPLTGTPLTVMPSTIPTPLTVPDDKIDHTTWAPSLLTVHRYLSGKKWGPRWMALLETLTKHEWSFYHQEGNGNLPKMRSRPGEYSRRKSPVTFMGGPATG